MNNFINQLNSLSDEKFISRFEQISSVEGIYHALRRSIEVAVGRKPRLVLEIGGPGALEISAGDGKTDATANGPGL